MIVAVRRCKIQRHRPCQIDRQLRAGHRVGLLGALDVGLVGGIQERGDRTGLLGIRGGLHERRIAIFAVDDEADRPEALFAVERPTRSTRLKLNQQRRARARLRKVGVRVSTRLEQHATRLRALILQIIDQMQRARRLDRRQNRPGAFAVGCQRFHGCCQSLAEFGGLDSSRSGANAALRDINVLRRRTHLCREQTHRRSQTFDHGIEIFYRVDNDRVHARSLRVTERRPGVRFDPRTEARTACEIDDGRLRMFDQHFAERLFDRIEAQCDEIRVKTARRQHLATLAYSDRHGQHTGRVWFDDHSIASR